MPRRRTSVESPSCTMRRRDATGGRFETLDLRRALPMKFKVRATRSEVNRLADSPRRCSENRERLKNSNCQREEKPFP